MRRGCARNTGPDYAILLFCITEGLRFIGVVYNLIAVGAVMVVFVIFVPRGLAGIRLYRRGRQQRADRLNADEDADKGLVKAE